MFLHKKSIRAFSIRPRNEIPPKITDERRKELVVRLRLGDKSVMDELISGHMRLAIFIAGLYLRFAAKKSQDLVSEAYLALVKATHKAVDGLKDDDYDRYVAFRIHRACGNFCVTDRLIRIPVASRWRNGLKDERILPEQDVPNRVNVSPLNQMILDETLRNAIVTDREKLIVDMRLQGFTHEEISKVLDIDRTVVTREIADVKKRFFKGD
jgi:RNA polymerase sigma factor (sigma-70 family)